MTYFGLCWLMLAYFGPKIAKSPPCGHAIMNIIIFARVLLRFCSDFFPFLEFSLFLK